MTTASCAENEDGTPQSTDGNRGHLRTQTRSMTHLNNKIQRTQMSYTSEKYYSLQECFYGLGKA